MAGVGAADGRPAWSGRSRLARVVAAVVSSAAILGVAFIVNQPIAATGGFTPVALAGAPTGPHPVAGSVAPDLTATTVDGRTLRLSDLRGRPVWLTFGASWCQPCRAENPDIQAAYENTGAAGLAVVAVFIAEDPSVVEEYGARVGLTYSQIADPDRRLTYAFGIVGIPTHVFIDRMGIVRQVRLGTLSPGAMAAELEDLGR